MKVHLSLTHGVRLEFSRCFPISRRNTNNGDGETRARLLERLAIPSGDYSHDVAASRYGSLNQCAEHNPPESARHPTTSSRSSICRGCSTLTPCLPNRTRICTLPTFQIRTSSPPKRDWNVLNSDISDVEMIDQKMLMS